MNEEFSISHLEESIKIDDSGIISLLLQIKGIDYWFWDLRNNKIYLSESSAKILGLEFDRIYSPVDFQKLFHSNDLTTIKKTISEALIRKGSFEIEFRLVESGGELRWITVDAKVDVNEKNEPVRIYGISIDNTESIRAKEKLIESETRLKKAEAIAHVGSWQYDNSDGSLKWSDEVYRIFGKNPAEYSPSYESFLQNIYREDKEKVADAFESSIEKKEHTYKIRHRVVNEITGDIRWVLEKCFHNWNFDGTLSGSSGVVIDITDRELLTQKYKSFYQSIQKSPNAVLITDISGLITYVNPAFSRLYGYSEEEVLGKNPRILNPGRTVYYDAGFDEEQMNYIFSSLWNDLKDPHIGFWNGRLLNKTKNGDILRVNLFTYAVRNDEQAIISYVGLPVDVSEEYAKEVEFRIHTFRAIADLAEQRDNETGQHMKRIGEYSYYIAQKLGLPQNFCEDIKISAPLHDIGKVGISDSILLAERSLTNDEFEVMKSHTVIGYEILNDRPNMKMAAEIAYSHQEKYDGSGYPRGLSGDSIPLSARITTLADVYDALRSERPYKKPFDADKSYEIIMNGKGSHFDPEIVEIFSENRKKFEYIFSSMS